MSVTGALAGGRRAALLLMTDTCVAYHPGAISGGVSDTTWARTHTADSQFYSGACRFKTNRVQNPSPSGVAGAFVVDQDVTMWVPAGSPAFDVQDIVVITGSKFDNNRVGLRLRVISIELASQSTSQRFQVEVIVG